MLKRKNIQKEKITKEIIVYVQEKGWVDEKALTGESRCGLRDLVDL